MEKRSADKLSRIFDPFFWRGIPMTESFRGFRIF
jgi:hypothetical protein